MNATRLTVIGAYAAMCFIWGTTWLAIKIGLHGMGPLTSVGVRFVIAGAALYLIAFLRKEVRPLRELPWGLIGTLALFTFVIDYSLIYVAETHVESGMVAVLFGTMPFFTFAFSRAMLNERTSMRAVLGACVAFAGVAVVSFAGMGHTSALFSLAVLGAAAAAAYGNVYAKRYGSIQPLVSLPPSMLIGGGFVLLLGLLYERTAWQHAFTPSTFGALLYLIVAGSGITFFLLLWLIPRLPAGPVGMATLIFPIIAIFAGVVFGGEHVGMRELDGSALVAAGIAIAVLPLAPIRLGATR